PQTNDQEDQLNLHRSEEIGHHDPRTKHGTGDPFCASDVPHVSEFFGLPDLMRCFARRKMLKAASTPQCYVL
ncbi:MAG: hypothetical protein VXW14_07355, partial [Candidatus Thermoplasmatota archaeon]|nr:hypothetical protein [Candidatus Thermoplasmatota archaeon]